MKNIRIIILIITAVVFLSGAALFLYPAISDYFNKKNSSKIINSYMQKIEETDIALIEEELQEAYEYNSQLYEHMIVLTDPFDPDAFPITDEQYESVLDFDEIMAYVEIPAIDVYLPVYHGTTPETLEKGVGHLENTSMPVGGESTHTVLSAHCGLPSALLFTNLDKLKKGNIFKIHVLNQTLVYKVTEIETVLPENCSTLYIHKGEDTATLLTCTPYGENTHRLLVHGTRIADEEVEIAEENEPTIEKEVTTEDWLNIAMITLSVMFFVLLVLVIIKSCRKDNSDE